MEGKYTYTDVNAEKRSERIKDKEETETALRNYRSKNMKIKKKDLHE